MGWKDGAQVTVIRQARTLLVSRYLVRGMWHSNWGPYTCVLNVSSYIAMAVSTSIPTCACVWE